MMTLDEDGSARLATPREIIELHGLGSHRLAPRFGLSGRRRKDDARIARATLDRAKSVTSHVKLWRRHHVRSGSLTVRSRGEKCRT